MDSMYESILVFIQGLLMFAIACASTFEKVFGLSWHFEVIPTVKTIALSGVAASFLLISLGGIRLGKFARILPEPAKNAPLRTTGAYAYCRHPIYSGLLLASLFWSLFLGSYFALLLGFLLLILLTIKVKIEERYLRKIFGNEYFEYQKKVGMFFPRIFKKKCCC